MGTNMRLILGMVNVLLFYHPCVSTQPCPANLIPPEMDSPESGVDRKPPAATGFMSSIVHSFLSSVQPNPFPKDLVITILKSQDIQSETTMREVLRYEAGFLVCVAIGIVYIVLMPLIGMGFACCRCLGKCGGRMHQEQTNSINYRRRSFYWATFLITVLILAGNICMFLSNSYTHESVQIVPSELNDTLKNLQSYITSIPRQLDQVVNESIVVVDNVTNNLNGIGPLLGGEIQRGLQGSINPALNAASVMAQVVQNTSLFLLTLNATQKELDLLQSNLTGVKTRINKTLQNPNCIRCVILQSELDKLFLVSNLNLSSFSALQSVVDQPEMTSLNAQLQKGNNFIESIPERLTNATNDSLQKVQKDLQTIRSQVLQVTRDIPVDNLNEFSKTLDTVQEQSKKYTPKIDQAENVRWNIAVTLCCLILLVVVCNLLGLMFGPAGLVPKDDPTDRSSTANCGGLLLMTGVGFSFLFSWIFMIVVLILFLVGGNMYTIICVPWKNQELFQLIDTPGVIPGFQLSQNLGLKTNLTISEVYKDCQMNKGIWSTLHLEDIIDLNNYLNVSKYTGQVKEALESSNITLPSIVLLDSETKKQISNFSATASSVNLSGITEKVITPPVTQLKYTANKLDALANEQPNATVKAELHNETKVLRFIQIQLNSTKLQLMELERFSALLPHINAIAEDVLQKASSAQDVLNNNLPQTFKNKLTEFIDCQIVVFTSLAEWAKKTITEQVGRCGPIAVTVNTVENIFCSQLLDSLNAFWFSLGWCMVFLIPSIILSVKLAKFYRQMKYKEELMDDLMLSPIPRANLKPN